MNKSSHGWGLPTLLLMICIIIIALLTSTLFVIRFNSMLGRTNNESEEKVQKVVNEIYYIGKMNELTLATNKYIDDFNINLNDGIVRIDLYTLVNSDYIDTIKDSVTKARCKGYSEAFLNRDGIKQINSYIKCDSYTTPDYRD